MPSTEVVVLDNLRRRGSELNVGALTAQGVLFVHGDVRERCDLDALSGNFDILIEASADAAVTAGMNGSPRYVFDTNLVGALNCLEFARERCGGLLFLSSSRVYPIEPLRELPLTTSPTRLDVVELAPLPPGVSNLGISETFSLEGHRSYYGASKLAAELLCKEYAAHGGLRVVVNRCGVIAGPGQFGRTDQGVFTLWVARHYFGRPLSYTGFDGQGRQVRDLLHVADLADLLERQIQVLGQITGEVFNVGGGRPGSVSLREFTELCTRTVGREVPIGGDLRTSPMDIPWFITDHRKVSARVGWVPRRRPQDIVVDIHHWIRANEQDLKDVIQ
jgi:CDP-paratose 2-epimerase